MINLLGDFALSHDGAECNIASPSYQKARFDAIYKAMRARSRLLQYEDFVGGVVDKNGVRIVFDELLIIFFSEMDALPQMIMDACVRRGVGAPRRVMRRVVAAACARAVAAAREGADGFARSALPAAPHVESNFLINDKIIDAPNLGQLSLLLKTAEDELGDER